MKDPNNVDKALTLKPEADQWDDHAELSEPTVSASLKSGQQPDQHFASAHEIGEELRRLRREGRDTVAVEQPPSEPPVLVQFCDTCGHYCWGRHGLFISDDVCGSNAMRLVEADLGTEYYEHLGAALEAVKGRRKKPPTLDTAEWRDVPNYPGYQMHSNTRDLWRTAHEVTLSNGKVRTYGSKKVTARNGSYSMSVNGHNTSRGVNALYRETFPEVGKAKRKRIEGEWASEIEPNRTEFSYYHGVGEWLGEGAAGIVTRPK